MFRVVSFWPMGSAVLSTTFKTRASHKRRVSLSIRGLGFKGLGLYQKRKAGGMRLKTGVSIFHQRTMKPS